MRNLLAGVLVLLALVFAVRRVVYHASSPEQQIRARLASMAAGFNDTFTNGVLDGFAEEYRDDGGTDREGIRDALLYLFFQELAGDGQGFALRVELPEEELVVEVDPEDPARAVVSLRAVFHRRRGGQEDLYWDASGRAELEDRGSEWEIVRTSDFNHRDRRR